MNAIVAIRPEPGLSSTIVAGKEIGLTITGWPLFEILPCEWEAPPVEEVDGILLGSANAIRHGGEQLAVFRAKPVYAVGESTAIAARDAGFAVALVGAGGLQSVLQQLHGKHLKLLRLAAEDRVTLHPPQGIELLTRIVYHSAPIPMPQGLVATLRKGALVLVHSAAALRHLADQCDRKWIDRSRISLATLSPRIAQAAGPGWQEVTSAERPREQALLALAQHMCHTGHKG